MWQKWTLRVDISMEKTGNQWDNSDVEDRKMSDSICLSGC